MRFLRLDLRNFGPFEDARPLDLGGGDRGLHLIQGPNEAGKSTALRAIRHLLFDFPTTTDDRHGREYDTLRIGATIRGESGDELAFFRRKRKISPLWDAADAAPIEPDALAPYLRGIAESEFVDFFSMDHAELVKGGGIILNGKGTLGEQLFAAGSGLVRVEEVRKSLDAEMEALFKPTGKNPSINSALAGLKEARAAADKIRLGTDEWVKLDEDLARAGRELEGVDADRRRLEAEKRRLEALLNARPVIDRLDAAASNLEALSGVAVLSEGFSGRRHEATAARNFATKAAVDATRAIEAVDKETGALGPPEPILGEGDTVRRLQEGLDGYKKAIQARPTRSGLLARLEGDALALLGEVRPGASPVEAETPRVADSRKESIRALGVDFTRLDIRRSTAEGDVERLLADHPSADGPAPGPEATRLSRDLADALARGLEAGDLEALLAGARDGLDRDAWDADVELRRLPLWSGTLDGLEVAEFPPDATLNLSEIEARAADEALRRAEDDLAAAEADRLAILREIEHAETPGAAPSEEDLARRRSGRDEHWRQVRRAWLGGEPEADPPRLAADFEADVRAADDAADRLRREADLVAGQARRRLEHGKILDRIEGLKADLSRKAGAREAIRREWRELWLAIGIDPLSPGEMKDWTLKEKARLVRKAGALREARAAVHRLAARVEGAKAELDGLLVALGEPPARPGESLASLRGRARGAVANVEAAHRLATARSALAKAEAGLDDWRRLWAEAVGPLGLGGDASPAQAQATIAGLDKLALKLAEVRDLRASIDEQARLTDGFEADVRALVGRLAPDLAGRPAGDAARELAARLDRARDVETGRKERLRRRSEEQEKLAEAGREVDRAEAALAALVAEAGCGSAEGLPKAEDASDEVRSLRKELRTREDQLATLAGSSSVATLRDEAAEADPEAIEAAISKLSDRLAPLAEEGRRLSERIGGCKTLLAAMDGGPAAADARQDLEGRIARLAVDVERYARLRLASAVLRDAVERHREKNQGPVLARAGAHFARLTAGSFAGLRVDLDDKGQPVLRGLRAVGPTLLGVEGMSDGTADQLYLALRLASLEVYLDDHEPMPLVLDDILVNFDNARARAALQALAELSRRTQVLFFTHHDHLVDLARSALGEDVLYVHRLTFPPARLEAPEGEVVEGARPRRRKKAATAGEG